jgi:hypothetical protein
MSAYIHLGNITVGPPVEPILNEFGRMIGTTPEPRVHEIWCRLGNLPEEWERIRLHYFPEYDGPLPTLFEETMKNLEEREERLAGRLRRPTGDEPVKDTRQF